MNETELRIGRRGAIAVLAAGGAALACSLPEQIRQLPEKPEEQFVYFGETKKLIYFTFSQQIPGIYVVIVEPKIREYIKALKIPLPDPSSLAVNLLDREKYPSNEDGPMSSQGGLEVTAGEINVSGEHLLGDTESQEKPPEFIASWFASMTLFEGLTLSAVRRGELSLQAAKEKVDAYNKKLFESLSGENQEYITAVLYENRSLPTPPPNAPGV